MSAHPPNAALSDLHISPAHWTRRSEPTLMDQIFEELGIAEYLETFKANGFENWSVVLDITESDFDALGVKLGHRRKLQRKIANSRGLSPDRALASPRNTPAEERTGEEQKSSTSKQDGKDRSGTGGPQGSKRKYRRHPKADENCPERPPSAYVIFSNKMREELKGRNLSFTEIAKLVGENWQNLAPAEKEPYEQQAFSAKERYNGELAEYKKTAKYQEYAQYLVEFKARQANQQQAPDAEGSKRPKLEARHSTASSGTASSSTSQLVTETLATRGRVDSSASYGALWQLSDNSSTPQPSLVSKVGMVQAAKGPSPPGTGPTVLPGYREAMFANASDAQREDSSNSHRLPRLATILDSRAGYPNASGSEEANSTSLTQHPHRTRQSHPPSLMTADSNSRSTMSSQSGSSSYVTPHTPLEPPVRDRSLPLPSLYSQKSTGSSDSQISSFRPPSLSPQSTQTHTQQMSNLNQQRQDYSNKMSMAPIRGLTSTTPQNLDGLERPIPRGRDYKYDASIEEPLDPVSALLRAGEIVNQKSMNQQNRPGTGSP